MPRKKTASENSVPGIFPGRGDQTPEKPAAPSPVAPESTGSGFWPSVSRDTPRGAVAARIQAALAREIGPYLEGGGGDGMPSFRDDFAILTPEDRISLTARLLKQLSPEMKSMEMTLEVPGISTSIEEHLRSLISQDPHAKHGP